MIKKQLLQLTIFHLLTTCVESEKKTTTRENLKEVRKWLNNKTEIIRTRVSNVLKLFCFWLRNVTKAGK